jgi:hypothetical protein
MTPTTSGGSMKARTIRVCGGKPSRFTIYDFRFFSVLSLFSVARGIDYLRLAIDYCERLQGMIRAGFRLSGPRFSNHLASAGGCLKRLESEPDSAYNENIERSYGYEAQ